MTLIGGENTKTKNIIFLLGMLLIFVSITTVSADSNITADSSDVASSDVGISAVDSSYNVNTNIDEFDSSSNVSQSDNSNGNSDVSQSANSNSKSDGSSNAVSSSASNVQNNDKSVNTVISGKISNCNDSNPFAGATVYVKSLSGEILAQTISDIGGNYYLSFYSLDSSFIVMATYPGHVSPSTAINFYNSNGMRYGVANLKFGTLNLTKGSSDILSFDSNNFNQGPNQYIVQIRVTNNAGTTATDVWANFSWIGANSHINLSPGQNASQFIGDIAPGQTVDVFFLVTIDNTTTDGSNRTYVVNIGGTNTGAPIDNITGNLIASEANSQNRNHINSIQVSNNNPNVGDFITVTVLTSTSSSNFAWINLPIEFDPSILRLVSVNTTYGGQNTSNIYIPTPAANSFVTVWYFEVIGAGNNTFLPWVLDASGNSLHYNAESLNVTINAIANADMAITKTTNDSNPTVDDTVNFTVTVTNNGPDNATGVVVSDLINTTQMDYLSSIASTGTYNSTTGIWTIGNLTVNGTATLVITVRIKTSGQIINIANVTANENDPNVNNNVAVVVLSAENQTADLSVNKVVNDTTPFNGGTVVFNVTVVNNGPDTAFNSTLTDILPAGLILLLADPSVGTYDSITGIWIIGDLTEGSQATLLLTCMVNGTGNITNIVNVTSDTQDPFLPNNVNNVTITVVPVADLGVVKTANSTNPFVGENINYTIVVTNNGPDNATGVSVVDNLPAGLIFVSSSASKGSYNFTDGIWIIGNLTTGETVYLNITVLVNASGFINNTAIVRGTEADLNSTNDIANVTIDAIPNADVAVAKIVNNTSPINGDLVMFTVTVTNNGPSNTTGVVMNDLLPVGLQFVSANPSIGSYDSNTGIWTIGNLNVGDIATLEIVVRAIQSGNITNIANVSSALFDPILSNNVANVTIEVQKSADLGVTKIVDNNSPLVGTNVTYIITVVNNGPDNATFVNLVDILGPGMSILNSIVSQGTLDVSNLTWDLGNLSVGSTAILVLEVLIEDEGLLTNNATVSGAEFDPFLANNTASVTIDALPVADVGVIKTVSNATPKLGDIIKFTAVVTNYGPSSAGGVMVIDPLPNGLEFVSYTSSKGIYNSTFGVWNVGTLADGESATMEIFAKVVAENTTIVNTAIQIHSIGLDTNVFNDVSIVSIDVAALVENVTISKIANVTKVRVGDLIEYTITVKNNGNGTAVNVLVVDKLDSRLKLIAAIPSVGSYNSTTGIWTIGDLDPNETATLIIIARAMEAGLIVNLATLIVNGTVLTTSEVDVTVVSNATNITNETNGTGNNNEIEVESEPVSLAASMKTTAVPIAALLLVALLCGIFGFRMKPKK